MTYEEAIIILRDTPIDIRSSDDIYTLYATAQGMAIDALKRQIPRKPIIRKTEDYFGYVKYILCPSCKEVEFGFNQPSFCDRCGQAIDWKVSE